MDNNNYEVREIYDRVYDNEFDKDGVPKPRAMLGKFAVIQQLEEDFYSEIFVGQNLDDQIIYLVVGREVYGINGGMRYKAIKLPLCHANAGGNTYKEEHP